LAAIRSSITAEDHIEVILDNLSDDYNSFITSVTSRFNQYTVEDIETLLLAQAERFEKHRSSIDNLVQANVVTGPSSTFSNHPRSSFFN